MIEIYGVKNTVLETLVTDGHRQPLVFGTEAAARRWFRLNGHPRDLVMVSTLGGVTADECKRLVESWGIQNGR